MAVCSTSLDPRNLKENSLRCRNISRFSVKLFLALAPCAGSRRGGCSALLVLRRAAAGKTSVGRVPKRFNILHGPYVETLVTSMWHLMHDQDTSHFSTLISAFWFRRTLKTQESSAGWTMRVFWRVKGALWGDCGGYLPSNCCVGLPVES